VMSSPDQLPPPHPLFSRLMLLSDGTKKTESGSDLRFCQLSPKKNVFVLIIFFPGLFAKVQFFYTGGHESGLVSTMIAQVPGY
jgi:hypothetical protein